MTGWRNLIGHMEETVARRPAVEYWILAISAALTIGVGIVLPVYGVVVFWDLNRDVAEFILATVAAGWCVYGLAKIPRRR